MSTLSIAKLSIFKSGSHELLGTEANIAQSLLDWWMDRRKQREERERRKTGDLRDEAKEPPRHYEQKVLDKQLEEEYWGETWEIHLLGSTTNLRSPAFQAHPLSTVSMQHVFICYRFCTF